MTQVAEVAVNKACNSGVNSPVFDEIGRVSSSAPPMIIAKKLKQMTRTGAVACRARLCSARSTNSVHSNFVYHTGRFAAQQNGFPPQRRCKDLIHFFAFAVKIVLKYSTFDRITQHQIQ